MCDDKKNQCQGDCCDEGVTPAPAFDMFASQALPDSDAPPISESVDDAMARAIIESLEKLAKGIVTLQQEIGLLAERVEAHEAHLAFLLSKDPVFQQFLKDKTEELKTVAVKVEAEQSVQTE
jgi:hypothetical protein